jgi:hypothetical protein
MGSVPIGARSSATLKVVFDRESPTTTLAFEVLVASRKRPEPSACHPGLMMLLSQMKSCLHSLDQVRTFSCCAKDSWMENARAIVAATRAFSIGSSVLPKVEATLTPDFPLIYFGHGYEELNIETYFQRIGVEVLKMAGLHDLRRVHHIELY